MIRLRALLALIMLCGAVYAAVGVFQSLTHFAVGLVIVASAVIADGLVEWMATR